ncbi:MAG TPA: HEAT repeat domain-containing protein [Anaerolineales bacterium]|nr:HEAT repeat domain-containing protein [Anaerolineales bacterium]
MKATRNVRGLIKALQYKRDVEVRVYAARALGELCDARTIPSLIVALEDKEFEVRAAAAEALGNMGDARAVEPLIHMVEKQLRPWSGDWKQREAGIKALLKIGAPAVDALIAAPGDRDPHVLYDAVRILRNMGDTRAAELLVTIMKKWYLHGSVRDDASKALAEIGMPAVDLLIAALEDKQSEVRAAAAEALGKIDDARAVGPLIHMVEKRYTDWGARCAAWKALENIQGIPTVDSLSALLKHTDWDVREFAATTLERISHRYFVGGLQTPDARHASEALQAYEKEKETYRKADHDLNDLIEALGYKGDYWVAAHVRASAAEVLGKLGDAHAIPALIVALEDEASEVRVAALKAVAKIPDARAVEPLVTMLSLQREPDHIIMAALKQIGETAVDPLIPLLKHHSWNVRHSAAIVLKSIGSERSVAALQAYEKEDETYRQNLKDQQDLYEYTKTPECAGGEHDMVRYYDSANGVDYFRCRKCGQEIHWE